MAKVTLVPISRPETGSGTSQINNNFSEIAEAFENTLSRDGSSPNHMQADLDMDGNDLLNVGLLQANDFLVGGTDLTGVLERAASAITISETAAEQAAESEANAKYWSDRAEEFADTGIVADSSLTYVKFGTDITTKLIRNVGNISAIKTIPTDSHQMLNLIGSKRRGLFYKSSYAEWTDVVAADTSEGFVVRSLVDPTVVWVRVERELTPQMFGAQAASGVDDYAAIMAWFNVLKAVRTRGITGLLNGLYYVTQNLILDFTRPGNTGTHGMTIRGSTRVHDGFHMAPGCYVRFQAEEDMFCIKLLNMRIVGNLNGNFVQIGKDDFSDAWNSCEFEFWVQNGNTTTGSGPKHITFNHVLQSKITVAANGSTSGRPVSEGGSGVGSGTAVWFRQVLFCHVSLAAGNANIGLLMNNGYNEGNTFDGTLDIEEVLVGVQIAGANCTKNIFLGGTIVASTLFNATAGNNNLFVNTRRGIYPGGSVGTNLTGLTVPSTTALT